MTALVSHIDDDAQFTASMASQEGGGVSWRKNVTTEPTNQVLVAVWKADPGVYNAAGRAYAETFIVTQGVAHCAIGSQPAVRVAPGSIVHIPAGAAIAMRVESSFRKFTVAVTPAG